MANIKDIARMAGVSTTTVSHVVNKTRYVSPELVKRVEDIISQLEDPPKFVLKKDRDNHKLKIKTKYVVLLTRENQTPSQIEFEKYIQKYLEEEGYLLVSVAYDNNPEKLELYSQTLLSFDNAVGLIVFPKYWDKNLEKMLSMVKVPVITINKTLESLQLDTVLSDDYNSAYRSANYLIKSGHDNIAVLCSDEKTYIERITGYKNALQDNGVQEDENLMFLNRETKHDVYSALKKMQELKDLPTALILLDYNVVVPTLKYIDEYNIACPKEMSIISCDNFDWAKLYHPTITTIVPKVEDIAKKAVSLLLKRIQKYLLQNNTKLNLVKKPEKFVYPTELHIRESTRGIGRGPFGEKAGAIDSLYLTDEERKLVREGNYTAAISFHYTGTAWSKLHEKGIKDEFNSLGISLLAITDALFDPVMQSKQLKSLLTLEPNVIISMPTESKKTSEAYKEIVKSDTKLILITNVPVGLEPGDYESCISVNEHSYGRSIGHGLGDCLREYNKFNVGLIEHGLDFYATNQRDNAVEQILVEEYPELVVCGKVSFENEDEVKQKTIELMKAHPEIDGIYVSWERPAMSVLSALNEIGRTDVMIATADLEYDLAYNMARGGMIKVISTQRPYEQGRAMALAAANSLLGKQIPQFIGMEPLFVTRENLLKTWELIFKKKPPTEFVDCYKKI